MTKLSHYIVRDGEGAKKFITIKVVGATTYKNAKRVALTIANSPLFKTAMAGSDSNWGRVIMAIGKSGVKINSKLISIKFGEFELVKNGEIKKNLKIDKIDRYLKGSEIKLFISLGKPKTHSTSSDEEAPKRQTVEGVDESLENILQELKERGIGNS